MTDSRNTSLEQVEQAAARTPTGLRPWMRHLALWHSGYVKWPLQDETKRMAEQLAGCRIARKTLRLVLNNPEWIALREDLAVDHLTRERQRVEAMTSEFVDAHRWALQRARENEDYKAVAVMTKDVVDRIWPKREERADRNTAIVINIGSAGPHGQAHVLEPLEAEIVVDPVEVESVESSGGVD